MNEEKIRKIKYLKMSIKIKQINKMSKINEYLVV